jgi:hypothetical protein
MSSTDINVPAKKKPPTSTSHPFQNLSRSKEDFDRILQIATAGSNPTTEGNETNFLLGVHVDHAYFGGAKAFE